MADERISKEHVLAAIRKSRRYTLWTACTTLERMGIERYPHQPRGNRLAMRAVLAELCQEGWLVERDRLHSHFTFKEVAYELGPEGRARGEQLEPSA